MIAELRTKLRIAAGANVSAWKRAMLPVAGRSTSTIAAPLSNRVIAIGASTGGTDATQRVLAGLPRDTPGVVVVQHMPAVFTAMYADRLNQELGLRVVEATDGDALRDGTVYIAPGEQQCAVVRASGGFALRVRRGPKVSGHCPSVDVMFGSVAVAAGSRAVGAILTGMGRDGAEGLLAMRRAGARTFAQDEATSVVYGMPREAWDCGAAEARVGVDAMADAITRAAGETVAPRVVAR
jgi:two-component system chemotaxis response regulator CheB